jgi:hypothetical protein
VDAMNYSLEDNRVWWFSQSVTSKS